MMRRSKNLRYALLIVLGLLASGAALAESNSLAPRGASASRGEVSDQTGTSRSKDDAGREHNRNSDVIPDTTKRTSHAPADQGPGKGDQCDYGDGQKGHAGCDAVSAEAAHEQANYAFYSLLATSVIGILTLVAAGLAALYAARAAREARAANLLANEEAARAKRESHDAAEHTARALAYAARSADAANRQAEIAEDTAKRQLRAYVGFRQIRVSKLAYGNCPYFHVQMFNAGKSPALDIRVRLCTILCTTGDPDRLPVKMHPRPVPSMLTLLPGQHGDTGKGHETPVPDLQLKPIRSGAWTVVFAGWLSYRDIFGKRHYTTFKHHIDARQLDISGGPLITCMKGNVMN